MKHQVTLKRFKHITNLSEETLCFTADVFVAGVKAGTAGNRGCGGSTFVHIAIPDIEKLHTSTEWSDIVDELSFSELKKKEDASIRKSVEKQLARDIIFTKKGEDFKGRHFVFKKGNATPELAKAVRAKIATMPDADLILNDVPLAVAITFLVKTVE
jgi:hypothetical protein